MKYQLLIALFLIATLTACTNPTEVSNPEKASQEEVDSASLYAYFNNKISPTWDYSPDNDSVQFEFNEYGLPKRRTEMVQKGDKTIHFSIEYKYNLSDSTETTWHKQQFGGGLFSTEVRKFGKTDRMIWREVTDVNKVCTRTEFDDLGLITNIETVR
ncbi:MAG: hypothetical protein ABJG68_16845 [Crocinitomicaceae bacterium]